MNENNERAKRVVHRRSLNPTTMAIHWKPGNYSLTFHQEIALALHEGGFRYVSVDLNDSACVVLHFSQKQPSQLQIHSKINWVKSQKKDVSIKNATVTNKDFVSTIMSWLNISDGDYYYDTSHLRLNAIGKYVLTIGHIVEEYPLIENPPTPSVKTISVDDLVDDLYDRLNDATDQELCNELRRRGYEVKATKTVYTEL